MRSIRYIVSEFYLLKTGKIYYNKDIKVISAKGDKMKKQKIYLDTTIISYLQQEDSPKETEITLKLWDEIKLRKYDACISDAVFVEVKNCGEPKRTFMLEKISEVLLEILEINQDIKILAQKYIAEGIIPQNYKDDALHIAASTYYNCDFIISWNFSHIVRDKTIIGANGINRLLGYKDIGLISPQSIINIEEE